MTCIALAACVHVASGQTLYGVGSFPGGVEFVSIDPTTGLISPRISAGAIGLVGGIAALDPGGRRFFFMSNPDLYVVHYGQGTVTHTPLSSSVFPLLQFDPGSGTLYGVASFPGGVEFISIDPATGQITSLIPLGAIGLVGGISALDSVGHRFFFMSNPDLYVVDYAHGNVTHTPLSTNVFPLLQFDPSSGTLYGVGSFPGGVQFVSINPTSGLINPLVSLGSIGLVGGISALDPVGHRFFFMSNPDLYVVHYGQGTATHTPLSTAVFPLLGFDSAAANTTSVPTASFLTLVIFAALLSGVGVWAIRT